MIHITSHLDCERLTSFNLKVNGNGSEISGVKHRSGFGNKAAVPTDLFAVSENTSQKSGEWGFGLDFSESSVIPHGTISNSYSESKEKDVSDIGFSSSAGNGHVDDGQNSWAFKDAFSGTGSKGKVTSKMHFLTKFLKKKIKIE